MCLAALALEAGPRYRLVLAANRDEFFDRPAAPLGWWTPAGQDAPILAGRDLLAGGTWMGLSARGRLAIVTNVRQPGLAAGGPSRGLIVPAWLGSTLAPQAFLADPALGRRAPFNLLAVDLPRRATYWLSNLAPEARRLDNGITVLSNAASLDAPWPKVRRLRAGMHALLQDGAPALHADALADALFTLLADRTPAADEELPATGLPLARERLLAPAFIVSPDGRYGTRCSTLVITERTGRSHITRVWERSFQADGTPGPLHQATLPDWPTAG